jgi:hypothetical protein
MDDYIDDVMDTGVKAWGAPNAPQKSALQKWAREDWANYHG